jgi:hypothetical protein
MKRLSIALVATSLLALAACGSRTVNNSAAVNTTNDVYDVAPDSLTANDLGNSSSGGNASTGSNASSSSNSSSSGSGNSASSTAGNSH